MGMRVSYITSKKLDRQIKTKSLGWVGCETAKPRMGVGTPDVRALILPLKARSRHLHLHQYFTHPSTRG
ncbi:hypothetical protein QVD17_10484 [Tagetes erecta]|uniref:Uncharacterized protein n=1 Tax=Tagetes erecta TaxID=13708 RepID=A0AAD8L814_TARER|nr:hypothetical protein QVD17_10484 [Tagetes erecta]